MQILPKTFLILLNLLPILWITNAELFTALVEMEELLDTEAVLINNLDQYIRKQEDKLVFLNKKLDEYKTEHNKAKSDIVSYLSNPVSAYLLTKRLTSDWKEVENVMTYDVGEGK